MFNKLTFSFDHAYSILPFLERDLSLYYLVQIIVFWAVGEKDLTCWNLFDHEMLGEHLEDVEIIVKLREDILLDKDFASSKVIFLGSLWGRFL